MTPVIHVVAPATCRRCGAAIQQIDFGGELTPDSRGRRQAPNAVLVCANGHSAQAPLRLHLAHGALERFDAAIDVLAP